MIHRVNIMLRRAAHPRRKSQNQVQEVVDYFLMKEKIYLRQVNPLPLFQTNHLQVCKYIHHDMINMGR